MGLFIAFEGGEGAGKSAQARILYGRLCQAKRRVRILHEPGDTALGNVLRTLVTLPRQAIFSRWRHSITYPLNNTQLVAKDLWLPILPEAETLLFAAARAQLVAERIKPLLQKDIIVICDRYIYSTVAYQGYGHGLDMEFINMVNKLVSQGLKPDLVILLDVEPTKGLLRKKSTPELSKFEMQDIAFHQRVRQGYLKMAADDPQRWLIVNASQPKTKVTQTIWEKVTVLLHRGYR